MSDLKVSGNKVDVSVSSMLKHNTLVYFNIQATGKIFKIYNTDRSIARLFSINRESYRKRLIENVIKHDGIDHTDPDDTCFYHREIPYDVYTNRFKEEFAEELTLIVLGGNIWWLV